MVPGGALTGPTNPARATTGRAFQGGVRVVLLAGPGYSTDIVANYLATRVPGLVVVVENAQSRLEMVRRRARGASAGRVSSAKSFSSHSCNRCSAV